MQVPQLRQYLCRLSGDLQNLTQSDLTELKWPTRRRIMTVLFQASLPLRSCNEELSKLVEVREEEVVTARAMNLPRDERKEAEMIFRGQFMRVVVQGMERIRWPPAREAFSDPLDDLICDQKTFLSAVNYIIKIGGLSKSTDAVREAHSRPAASKMSSYHEGTPPSSAQSRQKRGMKDSKPEWNSSSVVHMSPEGLEPVTKKTAEGKVPDLDFGNISVISDESYMNILTNMKITPNDTLLGEDALPLEQEKDLEQELDTLKTTMSGPGMRCGRVVNREPSQSFVQREEPDRSLLRSVLGPASRQDMSMTSARTTSTAVNHTDPASPQDSNHLLAVVTALQSQNESLSKELKQLQASVAARDNAEAGMDNLMQDLLLALQDIVATTGTGVAVTGTSAATKQLSKSRSLSTNAAATIAGNSDVKAFYESPIADLMTNEASTVTLEEDEAFQREVAWEQAEALNKSKELSNAGLQGKGQTKRGLADIVSQGKVTGRGGRDLSMSTITMDKSHLTNKNNNTNTSTSSATVITQNTRNTQKKVTSGLIWRQVHDKIATLIRSWQAARTEAQQAFLSPMSGLYMESKKFLKSDNSLRVHQVLGVRAPSSHAYSSSNGLGEAGSNYWLDLPRIHALQQDLLLFSNEAQQAALLGGFYSADGGAEAKKVKKRPKSGGKSKARTKKSPDAADAFGHMTDLRASADSQVSGLSSARSMGSANSEHSELSDALLVSGEGFDPAPACKSVRQRQKHLIRLQRRACELSVHLACLAPIAPLALDSPYSSSMTGLECVLSEVQRMLERMPAQYKKSELGKADISGMNEACDRAEAEQLALVRVVDVYRRQLSSWERQGANMDPLFNQLGKNVEKIVDGFGTLPLRNMEDSLRQVIESLARCESSHIDVHSQYDQYAKERHQSNTRLQPSSDQHAQRTLQSPLELLQKGFLGEHMGELVQGLREAQSTFVKFERLTMQVGAQMQQALLKEMQAFQRAKREMIATIRNTRDTLAAPMPTFVPVNNAGAVRESSFDTTQSSILELRGPQLHNNSNYTPRNTATPSTREGRESGKKRESLEDRPPFDNSIITSPRF